MTPLVLVVLAVIWVVVLVPPALRARAESRPADSISAFHRQLGVLSQARPRWGRQPLALASLPSTNRRSQDWFDSQPRSVRSARPSAAAHQSTQKRRRDVFVTLIVAMAATLLLGFVPFLRVMWAVNAVIDGLFVAYVALLIHYRNVAAERDMKVRFLPTPQPKLEPAFLMRRSAN